jgi:eukaryotic-like serine/threonine-protein kinase
VHQNGYEWLRRVTTGYAEFRRKFQEMDGVEALHNNTPPIIHRDIKPENLLKLSDGNWVLADFGLAKFAQPSSVSTSFATASGKAMGTSGYAAPEQFRDFRAVCHRADVYSLGVLLWELFSTAWGQIDRSDLELPQNLAAVVLKATDKKATNRHASVQELRRDYLSAINR